MSALVIISSLSNQVVDYAIASNQSTCDILKEISAYIKSTNLVETIKARPQYALVKYTDCGCNKEE